MKGSIVRRGKDRYAIIVETSTVDPQTGKEKRKRKWHAFRGNRDEAETERRRILTEMDGGLYIDAKKTKVSEYLATWLERTKPQVSLRTHLRYAEIVATYINPVLGNVLLPKLQPAAIEAAYATIRTSRKKGSGELSPRTILHCHRVLSAALRQAVRWRLLTVNPAADIKAPKCPARTATIYSPTETIDGLEALRESWMHVPALLGLMCGIRRGEIAALRWGAVDLEKGQLAVVQSAEQTKAGIRYKEPKSGKSRTVALSPDVVAELKAHRLRQAEAMLRLGRRLEGADFVVAQADGNPYAPDSISREWRLLVIRHKLPRIRFHDTRHSHATLMLKAGVHPKIASERLGHSRVGITMDLYTHVVDGMQEEAVALVDAAMAKALQKRVIEG